MNIESRSWSESSIGEESLCYASEAPISETEYNRLTLLPNYRVRMEVGELEKRSIFQFYKNARNRTILAFTVQVPIRMTKAYSYCPCPWEKG